MIFLRIPFCLLYVPYTLTDTGLNRITTRNIDLNDPGTSWQTMALTGGTFGLKVKV